MQPNTPTPSTTLSEDERMTQKIARVLEITGKSWNNAMKSEKALAKASQVKKGKAIPRGSVLDRNVTPEDRKHRYNQRMRRQQDHASL